MSIPKDIRLVMQIPEITLYPAPPCNVLPLNRQKGRHFPSQASGKYGGKRGGHKSLLYY